MKPIPSGKNGTGRLKRAIERALSRPPRRAVSAPAPEQTVATFEDLHDQLVIYVDVLGVGGRLQAATTGHALFDVYQMLSLVQRELDLPSHNPDPIEQASSNRDVGKRILALSDGIVMAVDPVSSASEMHDPHDVVCMELENVIYAQGRLAERGIFLRGGVSHGRFFFGDDVLISPALADAYRLESQVAQQPRIIVHQNTVDWLMALDGSYAYSGKEPTKESLRPAADLPPGHYMLDYLPILANARDSDWVSRDDLLRYRTASSPKMKQWLLNLQAKKAIRRSFKWHRSATKTDAGLMFHSRHRARTLRYKAPAGYSSQETTPDVGRTLRLPKRALEDRPKRDWPSIPLIAPLVRLELRQFVDTAPVAEIPVPHLVTRSERLPPRRPHRRNQDHIRAFGIHALEAATSTESNFEFKALGQIENADRRILWNLATASGNKGSPERQAGEPFPVTH